ncbi:MAG: hypothetical protein MUF81_07490 [Verrucomicrobia bacterium]|nr:hypothetical protein [Verrucomicrobiota bacterium]
MKSQQLLELLGGARLAGVRIALAFAPAHHYALDLGFPSAASDDLSAKNPERTVSLARDLDAFVITGLNAVERPLAATHRQ